MGRPFGEEHEALRAAVRDFVDREVRPHVAAWEACGAVPRELFRRLGGLGWLGVRVSPEHGGQGLDFRYTAVLVQELVRCGSIGVPVSLLAHAEFATVVIDRAGTPELKARLLPRAVRGEAIGALAVTEPDAGSDVAALRTRAVRDGDEYVIDGRKTFITNGGIADFVTTAVRTGGPGRGGISLLVVPTDVPGFVRGRPLRKLGTHASNTSELTFEGCRVPASHLVGPEGGGFELIVQGFVGERLVLALLACAHLRLMWEEARRYGHERRAFGGPLLGFQVWRHRLADALATITAAEALTYAALERYVQGEPCVAEVAMAKLFAAEATRAVAPECVQIFGGNGYMEEYAIGRLWRDALAFGIGAGTSEMMREIIARTCGLAPERDGQP